MRDAASGNFRFDRFGSLAPARGIARCTFVDTDVQFGSEATTGGVSGNFF